MVNKILKILEENIILDKDLTKVIKAEYPYLETLACELDDLFAKRIVGKSLNENAKPSFIEWLRDNKYVRSTNFIFKDGKFYSFETLELKYKNEIKDSV